MLRKILSKNLFFISRVTMQRQPNKPKNFPQFTHFMSIPFIRPQHRNTLGSVQDKIHQIFKEHKLDHTLKRANTNLMHITLSMLTLNLQEYRQRTVEVMKKHEKQISELLKGATFTLGQVKYFTKFDKKDKRNCVSLFYFDIIQDENAKKLEAVTDLLIREMIKAQVINANELKSMHIRYDHRSGKYINDQYHMTLFRIQGLWDNEKFQQAFKRVQEIKNEKEEIKMVLECDYVDVSTRNHFDETNFYLPLARVLI